MSSIGSTNISFSNLRTLHNYNNDDIGATNISLSSFHSKKLYTAASVATDTLLTGQTVYAMTYNGSSYSDIPSSHMFSDTGPAYVCDGKLSYTYAGILIRLTTGSPNNIGSLSSSNVIVIGVEFPTAVTAHKYRIWPATSSGDRRDNNPGTWKIYGSASKSDFESGTRTELHDQNSQLSSSDWINPYTSSGVSGNTTKYSHQHLSDSRSYDLTSTGSYKYYVLYSHATSGDTGDWGFTDLQFYGEVPAEGEVYTTPSSGEISINTHLKNKYFVNNSLSGDISDIASSETGNGRCFLFSENTHNVFTSSPSPYSTIRYVDHEDDGEASSAGDVTDGITVHFSDFAGVNNLIGRTARIYFRFDAGTGYATDIQLHIININGTDYHPGINSGDFGYTNWKTVSTGGQTFTTYNDSSINTALPTVNNSQGGKWCYTDANAGNTPSQNTGWDTTGLTPDGWICYEGSSPNLGYNSSGNIQGWVKSPEFDITHNKIVFKFFAYGIHLTTETTMHWGVYLT